MPSLAQIRPTDIPTTEDELDPVLNKVALRAVALLTQSPAPDLDALLEECAQEFTWAIDEGPPRAVEVAGLEMMALVLAMMLVNAP